MSQESQEMLKILQNLENAQHKEPSVHPDGTTIPGNVSNNATEMYNILSKLQNAAEDATKKVVNESKANPELSAANIKENNININGQYSIDIVKKRVAEGISKKFYNISDTSGVIYQDICLFESAMGIVKSLMNDNTKLNKILDLDGRYGSHLAEAAMYKVKVRSLNEQFKKDIALAKQTSALSKMNAYKKQIKNLL